MLYAGPNASVHAYSAAQVKAAMDATLRLGGENYVFWGGREGYHTLLNTDLKCAVPAVRSRMHRGRRPAASPALHPFRFIIMRSLGAALAGLRGSCLADVLQCWQLTCHALRLCVSKLVIDLHDA